MATLLTKKQLERNISTWKTQQIVKLPKAGEVLKVDQQDFDYAVTITRHDKKSTYGEILYAVEYTYKGRRCRSMVERAGWAMNFSCARQFLRPGKPKVRESLIVSYGLSLWRIR